MERTPAKKILLIVLTAILFAVALLRLDTVWRVIVRLFDVVSPILVGLCIAFVMQPLAAALERLLIRIGKKRSPARQRIARAAAIALSYLLVLGVLTLIVLAVAPQVAEAVGIVVKRLPDMADRFAGWFNALVTRFQLPVEQLDMARVDWDKTLEAVMGFLKIGQAEGTTLIGGAVDAAAALLSRVFDVLMSVIISLYVLAQREAVSRFFSRLIRACLSPQRAAAVFDLAALTNTSFRNFVTGQMVEAVIIGVLCFIGMLIFRFPYAAATSAIIAVTALIPIFGAWIGGAVGALFVLTDSPTLALLFIVFILVLQQLEGNLIYPKVVGTSMGLPGLLVLIAVMLGGSLGGVAGMLLGVPLCAILYSLVKRGVARRLARREQPSAAPPEP